MRKKVEKNIAYDDVKELYYVTFYEGVVDGKKKQSTKTFTNKKKAQKALKEFEEEKEERKKGNVKSTDFYDVTMGEWFERYIAYKSPELEETTKGGYKRMVDNHLIFEFKDVKVRDVTPLMVDAYFYKKLDDGTNKKGKNPDIKLLSSNSLLKQYNFLNGVFNYAVKKDIIDKNIMEKVDKPVYVKPNFDIYKQDDMKELLSLLGDYYFDLGIKIAVYTGVRLSEACGLKWENVDLEKGLLYIRKVNVVDAGKVYFKEPKSKSSKRIIHIPEPLLKDLKKSKKIYDSRNNNPNIDFEDSGYVIFKEDGTRPHPSSQSRYFRKFLKQHNMKHIRFHDIRHSFGSIAVDENIPVYDVSKVMGHSKSSVTEKFYIEQIENTNKESVNAVAAAIAI